MKRDLSGKRILITGASSGIGRSLAEYAASAGMRIALASRSADELNNLAKSLAAPNREVFAHAADVTSPSDREQLFKAVVDRLGGLDILINNAGIGSQGLFTESSEEILRKVMEVNFFASAEMIRLAIPILERGQQPAVVQVASMCGARAMPFWSEYSASKYAIVGLMEALHGELYRYGIDVVTVLPGLTQTSLGKNLLQHNGRMAFKFENGMPVEKAARGIFQSLEKTRARTVLGHEAVWMVRAHRFFPRIVDKALSIVVKRRYAKDAPTK